MSKKELATRISKKKAELAPIIKDLKSLRESIDVTKKLYLNFNTETSIYNKYLLTKRK